MGYLLDTHTILWVLENEKRLSSKAIMIIEATKNDCFVSVGSLFEMTIKRKIGKLELSKSIGGYADEIERIGVKILPIKTIYLDSYENIPLFADHRDPFDRLLIATAFAKNLVIITDDNKFEWYNNFVEII